MSVLIMETRKLKRVVIKEELFALTGDTIETIILSQFLYWMDRVKDFDKFIKEEKQRSLDDGNSINIELQNGWVYKKASELVDECMLNVSEVTVRRYIQNLCKKGYLESRKNPSHKWDKTLQYRVNMKFIISEIKKLGYNCLGGYLEMEQQNEGAKLQNEGAKLQNEGAKLQNEGAKLQNEGVELQNEGVELQNEAAITEITTETTNKEISTKVDTKKEKTNFDKFNDWLKANTPNVLKLSSQMTEEQFNKLRSKYEFEQMSYILLQMENYKGLAKKYTSVYLTFNNWAKREYGTK